MADRPPLEERLARALAGGFGKACRVCDLRRLSGGANSETWSFDLAHEGGCEALILRRRPPGVAGGEVTGHQAPMEVEAAAVARVAEHGLNVPRVHYVLAPEDGLGRGYVMERIAGETLARRILRDARYAVARERLAADCGQVLAGLHALGTEGFDSLPHSPADRQVADFRARYESFDSPRPVFELAFRWAADRIPTPRREAVVHGDFRNGNIVVGEQGLTGVLDWELAHRGDPMEDLGWLCVPSWRFGVHDKPVGGFGDRAQLFEAYETAGGDPVDPTHVRFWEVFGALKWGVMCMGMYELHRSGLDASVERAAIGRRASETEIDLLLLLEGT